MQVRMRSLVTGDEVEISWADEPRTTAVDTDWLDSYLLRLALGKFYRHPMGGDK